MPNYIHVTAALSAGNVYMLYRFADLLRLANFTAFPRSPTNLTALAAAGTSALFATLYAGGPWGCLYPNGSLVVVRHVIDFAYVSTLLGEALPPDMANEMCAFATQELMALPWMRALSLSDPEAPIARPDHGSDGAYPAWPAMTASGLVISQNWSRTAAFLRAVAPVTMQGAVGQAEQLPNTPGSEGLSAPFKTNLGYTRYTALAGGAFADAVIAKLFGLFSSPSGMSPLNLNHNLWLIISAGRCVILEPSKSRGFEGTLQGAGTCPMVISDHSGLHFVK